MSTDFSLPLFDQETASLELVSDLPADRLHRVQCSFEMFQFGCYDVIKCLFLLPFIEHKHLPLVFGGLKAALKLGAIFVGQFFGINDTWNILDTSMTLLARQQVLAYLEGLKLLEFEEEEENGATTDGAPKHWHIYHTIARRL